MVTKNIYQKLADAKKEIGAIGKGSTNKHFKYDYFDINAILAAVEPILLKNGLIILQPIIDGHVLTKIIDIDSTNDIVESAMKLSDIADPQKRGSEITYFRRYTLQSLLSLQAEDDDGTAASKAKQATKKPEKEELIRNTMAFHTVHEAIKSGKRTIAQARSKYKIYPEVEQELLK